MGTKRSAGKKAKPTPRPGAGGYRPTEIGPLLHPKASAEDVAKAAKVLATLFAEHHSAAAVARALEVDRSSVERWVKRVVAAGHDDPRSQGAA